MDLPVAKTVPLKEDRPSSLIRFTSFLLLDAIFAAVVPGVRRRFIIFVDVPDLPALHLRPLPRYTATPARRALVETLAGGELFRGRLLGRGDLQACGGVCCTHHADRNGSALLGKHCKESMCSTEKDTICLSLEIKDILSAKFDVGALSTKRKLISGKS